MRWWRRGSWKDPRVTYALVHGFTQSERSWSAIPLDDAIARCGFPTISTSSRPRTPLGDEGGQATYVGYSMGGRLCLQLALDRPDLVDDLVLVSASPGIADDAERAARRTSDESLAHEVERDGVDAFLERWLAQPLFASLSRDAAGRRGSPRREHRRPAGASAHGAGAGLAAEQLAPAARARDAGAARRRVAGHQVRRHRRPHGGSDPERARGDHRWRRPRVSPRATGRLRVTCSPPGSARRARRRA